jgi:ABC-type Fe3+ transport system permease subunit
VKNSEAIVAGAIVIILLLMAIYFGWRQWQTLGALRHGSQAPREERRYVHKQAWRRLVCSALMIVLAGLFLGYFEIGGSVGRLVDIGEANRERNQQRPLTDEEKAQVSNLTYLTIAMLSVVLAIFALAVADFVAIQRYGQRQYRQIQADRQAMLERELARYRGERNGHG